MAVSVQDLIKQKDKILAKKDETFDLKHDYRIKAVSFVGNRDAGFIRRE